MNIRLWYKKRANNKYKKIKRFHEMFEIPSLEYTLYNKYKNKKWLVFLMFNAVDIGFIIFWLWSLFFVASMGSYCLAQTSIINEYYGSNFTGINLTINKTEILDLML